MTYESVLVEILLKDLKFNTPIPVRFDFGRSTPPIGEAYLEQREDGLFATIHTRYNLTGFTPAIGFTYKDDPKTGIIDVLSVSKSPNQDMRINPI